MVTVHVDVQLLKKIGKDNLLQILENEGYPCELEILRIKRQKCISKRWNIYFNIKNRQPLLADEDEDDE